MAPARRRNDSSDSDADASSSRRRPAQTQKKRARPSTQRRQAGEDSDSDSDAERATQRKGKSTQKSMEKMSKQDQVSKAWDIARLALCAEFTRKPLTRNEINKEVLGNYTRQFKDTLSMAAERTAASLGMELVELRAKDTGFGVEHKKKAGNAKKKTKKKQRRDSDDSDSDESSSEDESANQWTFQPGKQYILRSAFDQKTIAKAANVAEWPDEPQAALINVKGGDQLAHTGILYIILSLILVSGRELPDDRLRSHLKKLNVLPSTDLPINGATAPSTGSGKLTIDGLLRSFTQQGYLERVGKSSAQGRSRREQQEIDAIEAQTGAGAGGDPNTDWRWGARADAEIGESNMGHFIETFFQEPDADRSRQKEMSDRLWKNMGKAAGEELHVAQPLQAAEVPRVNKSQRSV